MGEARLPRVLDVGQCDFDHGNIARVLSERFGAEVDRCHTAEDALCAVSAEGFDLVLVNRIFDRDGSEGLKLIERLRAARTEALPEPANGPAVMLVSNYADAQDASVRAGGVRGFGKATLESPETMTMLRTYLGRQGA